jgi:hypothetical protein
MSLMKIARAVGLLLFTPVLLLASARLAAAEHMSLGANLGWVGLSTEGESTMLLSAPADPVFGIQPGLRIGFPGESGMDDLYFDTGLIVLESSSVWALTVNYQRNLLHSATSPYLTAGGGFRAYGFGEGLQASALFGGGLGVIHRLDGERGALRLELRLDGLHDPDIESTLTSVGIKAGFDVWLH